MCRLFAVLSVEPSDAKTYLLDTECSLYNLSHVRSQRLQKDGWGVAYYVNNRPIVKKSQKPLYEEPDQFKLVTHEAKSKIIVAHIRQASNPRRLTLNQLIGIENTQPFWSDEYVFAHNGTINLPDELEEQLGDYRAKLQGVNDSEIYFWYLMKEIHSGKDALQAFYSFVALLDNLWMKFRNSHKDMLHPYIGLNTILTDGKKLYAFCRFHKDYANSQLSLCQEDQKYFQMSYLPSAKHLVVASEKLTRDERWKILDTDEVLIAEILDEQVHHQVVKAPRAIVQ